MSNSVRIELPDLVVCEREPIHTLGSIQPHGLLVLAEPIRFSHPAD